jgi:hypothetical protein
MTARRNWAHAAARDRIRQHGSESVQGRCTAQHDAPAPRPRRSRDPPPRASKPFEPIEIGKFFKNRKGDVIVVQIKSFQRIVFCDIRQFFQNEAGVNCPTKKGVAVSLRKLDELARLIDKAIATARERGLIDEARS